MSFTLTCLRCKYRLWKRLPQVCVFILWSCEAVPPQPLCAGWALWDHIWPMSWGSVSLFALYFTTRAVIMKRVASKFRGANGKKRNCSIKARRVMFTLILMPQETFMRDFKERNSHVCLFPSVCISPFLVYWLSSLPSACLVQLQCIYDVLQYQFKVNRMQVICPSWQKENKRSPGSIYTPERKSVRLLPLPK